MAKEEQAGAENGELDEAAAKKRKLIIIGGAAGLVLVIAVVVAFLLLGGDDEAAAQKPAEEEAKTEEAAPSPVKYYKFIPEFLVNLPAEDAYKRLKLELSVGTNSDNLMAFIKENTPVLKHHLINLFSIQRSDNLATESGKTELANQAAEVINEQAAAMGVKEKVSGAYITSLKFSR